MKLGVDTNVLIYAHIPSLPEYPRVKSFLLSFLAQSHATLVLTPNILHELVHIVTDERRFTSALSMPEALAVARHFLRRPNVECASVDEAILEDALSLLEQHHLGRKRITDTLFAATLRRRGVRALLTCNQADFQIFTDLELIDPRTADPANLR